MARQTLFTHRKFRRLAKALKSEAAAVGHLEFLWHAGYQAGDPSLGGPSDVEMAAKWTGKDGLLVAALEDSGFIERAPDNSFIIHDFWVHAPEYVRRRRAREQQREVTGRSLTGQCPVTDRSMVATPSPSPSPSQQRKTPDPERARAREPELPAATPAPPQFYRSMEPEGGFRTRTERMVRPRHADAGNVSRDLTPFTPDPEQVTKAGAARQRTAQESEGMRQVAAGQGVDPAVADPPSDLDDFRLPE